MARARVLEDDPEQGQLDFAIVSPQLTIEAMRDSGYKDTDHALAELIDNSIEAQSDLIEVVAVETPPDESKAYARARVTEIAVTDNGEGMDAVVLRRALKFGDGTRKDREARSIGRFGIGLPQSSISQCQRVDIWTWRNGADNALRCYLDIEEIRRTGRQEVPKPTFEAVPDRWRRVLSNVSEPTGTLVVWSVLDRVRWSGGTKTLQRTSELCGRIYRKFISREEDPVQIDLILAEDREDRLWEIAREQCLPNDPLYLMSPSSTPEPFDDRPMFREFNRRSWQIPGFQGVVATVDVRCSMALPDAINEEKSSVPWPRSYAKAGDAPWGKHANRNRGVSIVRAGRELELSLAWVNNYEPQERWWSVEVEFDPVLDEIFGVVNNKQHAHAFVSGAGFDEKEAPEPNEAFGDYKERLKETGDPRFYLTDIWIWIESQIARMRKERANIMRGTGPGPRHTQTGREPSDTATDVINGQAEQGDVGQTDKAPETSPEEKEAQIKESLEHVVSEETASDWARETVQNDRRVLLKAVNLGHRDAFFGVESVNDVIEVWLNDRHPVHEHLIDVLSADTSEQGTDELEARLQNAAFALEMLLIAWARHEDKSPPELRSSLEDVRMDWGREARKFLDVIES